MKLQDTVGMYGIQLRQAQNSVKWQSVASENTALALDRAVSDAEIWLSQAQRTYDTVSRDVVEQKKQADLDRFNANPKNTGSTAALNLEKLRLDIEKANLDQTNITKNLDANFHLYANDIDKIVTAMIYDGDKILGISEYWRYNNDVYEWLLGTRVWNGKLDADNGWNTLYAAVAELRSLKDTTMNPENIETSADTLSKVYTASRNFNSAMISMLQNSLVGGWLTQQQLDGWISMFNGYKAQVWGSDAQFSAWKNQAVTGLASLQKSLDSLQAQLALGEKSIENGQSASSIGYTRTVIGLQDKLEASRLALDQAKKSLEIAKKNRTLGISQAGIGVETARIGLMQAQENYGKLTIDAPIEGKISKILTSLGQTVNMGTPVAEMVSDTPEMTVDVEADVALNLRVWDWVEIRTDKNTFTGSIVAVSRVANSNLLYTTRISVPEGGSFLWQAVKVFFTVESTANVLDDFTLPLSSINIVSENEGEIFILLRSGSILVPERKVVQLWTFRGDAIEILTHLPPSTEIIMTNLSHYDPLKQILVKKK